MKNRLGFVSNSSSSSFIVVGKEPEVSCVKLDPDIAKRILYFLKSGDNYIAAKDKKKINFDEKKEYFLTSYLSDSGDPTEPIEDLEHYPYLGGNHGGPYEYNGKKDRVLFLLKGEEDEYDSIYIRKKDLNPRQYFKNEVKKLSEDLGVKYTLTVK